MAREFLNAAERVLRIHRHPLLIQDIVQKGIDEGFLNTKGITPVNTMRARLSEEIRTNSESSIFVRVAPNKFALREWDNVNEYKSAPLEKKRNKENVVCIKQELIDKHHRFFGFSTNYLGLLKELKNSDNVQVINRAEANARYDIKQLVSYVILKDVSGNVLSFVRGNYGQKESLLKGVLCIGFGGHVNSDDLNDLFASLDAGITNSAYREISEEIKGLIIKDLNLLGIINDDSSPLGLNHLAFVYEAQLPTTFNITKVSKEKAISKLKLYSPIELWKSFHELEFWSQLVLKRLSKKPDNFSPVFIKTKNKQFDKSFLAVVGEIGSGKTEVAEFLADKYHLPMLSTRSCVQKLIGIKDFETENRGHFQDKAKELVSTSAGIRRLAMEIKSQAEAFDKACVIIDGIRNIETYAILKMMFPTLNLLYVDVPRDTAFKLFQVRSRNRKVSIHEFREARRHEVEKEISLFKTRADAYFFNGGTLKDLRKEINKWWHERCKT